MGNAVTQPARTFEKKILGVEDRSKSKVVGNGVNSYHFPAASCQVHNPANGGHIGSASVGIGGGQVSIGAKLHG